MITVKKTPNGNSTHALMPPQIKEVLERVARILLLLRKSASLWLEIAREVTEARNVLTKNAFELPLAKASPTRAIVDKMPRIYPKMHNR